MCNHNPGSGQDLSGDNDNNINNRDWAGFCNGLSETGVGIIPKLSFFVFKMLLNVKILFFEVMFHVFYLCFTF